MKVLFALLFALFSLMVAVIADDCDAVCNERNAAIVKEKDEIWHDREAIIRDKDELWHSREQVFREVNELRTQLEQAVSERDQARRLQEDQSNESSEVEEVRRELDKHREDMAHYQKVAQDNQKYMMEYKAQLATQRDRAAKLDNALKSANEKIYELENTSFLKNLQKEVGGAYSAINQYWVDLKGKGKTEGSPEF